MVSRVRRDKSSMASKPPPPPPPPLDGPLMPESDEEDSDSPADCFERRRPLENFLREGLRMRNFLFRCRRSADVMSDWRRIVQYVREFVVAILMCRARCRDSLSRSLQHFQALFSQTIILNTNIQRKKTRLGVPDRFLVPHKAFSVLHPPPIIVAQLAPKSVVRWTVSYVAADAAGDATGPSETISTSRVIQKFWLQIPKNIDLTISAPLREKRSPLNAARGGRLKKTDLRT